MPVARFSLHGGSELSSLGLVVECEINLLATSIPHQRRGIVTGRHMLARKTGTYGLRCCQLITADRFSFGTKAPTTRWARGWRSWNRCHGTLDIDCSPRKRPARSGRNGTGLKVPPDGEDPAASARRE